MSSLAYNFKTRALIALALPFLTMGCGSETPVQASAPDPGAPTLTCPAAPTGLQSLDGNAITVSFGSPTVTGGQTPLTGPTCTPAAGTTFKPGSTPVSCTVTDAKARAQSCTFTVTVAGPPTLSLTRFIAFGDSITAGEIPSEGPYAIRPRNVDPYLNYATDLTRMLTLRYQSQAVSVDNLGVQGETTSQGRARLPNQLAIISDPQVLLLMEGANDIPGGTASISPAVGNMQAMIEFAKGQGLKVFLGNLPPENPNACPGGASSGCTFRAGGAAYVVPYNASMSFLASVEGVPLVDVYGAFNGDVTTLIDTDGLHPTAAGYQVIATAFFNAIQKTLEVPAATSATSVRTRTLPAPRR